MKGEIIEITNSDTTRTRGKYFEWNNAHGRTVVALPGLGGTISAEMIIAISQQVEAIGNFSLYAFDHPHFGLNDADLNPETFSLEECERNASNAVSHVLSLPNTEKVVLIGSSLGFWSFFQILSKEAQGNSSKILALLGKSGIASYINVLHRFLDECWANGNYEDEAAWNKLLGNYKVNRRTGWGELTVNSGDQPVPIHANFFRTIPGYNEWKTTQKRVEAIHGEKDRYTLLPEMVAHNGWNIIVDIETNGAHDLKWSRANEKLIWRASSLLN